MKKLLVATMAVAFVVLFAFWDRAWAVEPKEYPNMSICGQPHKVIVDQKGTCLVEELSGKKRIFVREDRVQEVRRFFKSQKIRKQIIVCPEPKDVKVTPQTSKKPSVPKKSAVPKPTKPAKVKKSNEGAQNRPAAKPAANASATVATFDPTKPHGFWSRLWHGIDWIITGEWNKPVIPAITPTPAPTQMVPPKSKLKKRVINKRGPPKSKPCEQEIKVKKVVPASKPPMQTVAAPSCPPTGIQKPAVGQAEVGKSTVKTTEEKMPADSDVRRYAFIRKTTDVDGKPITKRVTITHQSWTNLPSKEVRRGFIWSPDQVMPPDWMQEVGGKMNGIDPETGQIREMEIPTGIAVNYSDRGSIATVVGKYSKVPDDRHLLKQINEEKRTL